MSSTSGTTFTSWSGIVRIPHRRTRHGTCTSKPKSVAVDVARLRRRSLPRRVQGRRECGLLLLVQLLCSSVSMRVERIWSCVAVDVCQVALVLLISVVTPLVLVRPASELTSHLLLLLHLSLVHVERTARI